jgi:hypothetical protein
MAALRSDRQWTLVAGRNGSNSQWATAASTSGSDRPKAVSRVHTVFP